MGRPRKDVAASSENQSSYEDLMRNTGQQNPPVQKAVPSVVRVVAQPIVTATAPVMDNGSDMAWLIDKTGKSQPLHMNAKLAYRRARKYPQEFEVRP